MPEYETPNENHGIWIPKAISSRIDLSQTAKLVYGYINGFTANGIEFYACNKTIGEWVGKEADTVSTAVSLLVELGLFDIKLVKEDGRTKRTLTAKTPREIGETADTHTAKTPNNNIDDNIENNIIGVANQPSVAKTKQRYNIPFVVVRELKTKGVSKEQLNFLQPYYQSLESIWLLYPPGKRRRKSEFMVGFLNAFKADNSVLQEIPKMAESLKSLQSDKVDFMPAAGVWVESMGWRKFKKSYDQSERAGVYN